ncbi:hypothetical protein Q3G72_019833 [Acer saccharum]|nr:hypothetical protein Q3G72_019833 [Acer saccharum]
MESLIGLVNRIQRACTVLGDYGGGDSTFSSLWEALPTVAVVGGQSSGKSSVLESIVGRDFLPRGSGIVTRRPLVLQLHKTEDGSQEYAEFLHLPRRKFTDFALVRKEISDETDRVTGKTKQISPIPIHLSIYSPNVVNLTLIDLPGLTKVAVEGQAETIVQDIENMVRSYVEKPNIIILAISLANQDIATSDAIKLAREVDPTGERTFGVLTKLDLMDKGTNALDVLEGRSYRLQHPWVGIVNRSQSDINRNVDMIVARRKEREYFATSPDYGHLASKMGSEYLAKLLSKHLESVIRARIPSITSLINKSVEELESEMDHLGQPIAVDAGGTAFSMTERDRLDLRGLLPPNVLSSDQQIERFMVDLKRLEVQARDGPSDPNALAKWRILNRLHDRNETMYYKVLIANIEEYAPIVYTPTVGLVCQNFSGLFRRPRGMYFSAEDRGEMMSMVYNWPADQVDMIVVTDGSRILGLGDLGVQGIGISIGKLDLYVAAAGINPQRVLPVMIDVGTNNEKLLKDPMYLGLQDQRLDGDEYVAIVDEFMEAVFTRWPHVIVQFEDFQSKWAFKLLQRYRNTYRMFNDDVQGTAGVAIAGLLGAVRAQGRPMIDFPKQKIVVAGAGSAGIGVLNAARKTMARMLGNNESAFDSARSQFWVVDAKGLITEDREDIDPDALPFARKVKEVGRQGLGEGASLAEVVWQVKPDVLLGLSAVGGLFSKEVLEAMKCSTSTRPAIFAMSNPTKNAECTPEEAFSIVGDNIIFASGSPFNDVNLGNGHIGHCNQGNNMYLFPGVGLGTLLSGSSIVSDGMLRAAAECLAAYMSEDDVINGKIYPSISSIRDITIRVAAAVVKEAIEEDLAEGYREMDARELKRLNKEEIEEYVQNNMWSPEYPTLVYRKE